MPIEQVKNQTLSFNITEIVGDKGFAIPGRQAYSNLGRGIGTGDLNGDGFADLAVSATGDSRNPGAAQTGEGSIYVIYSQQGNFPDVFDVRTLNGSNGFTFHGADLNSGRGICDPKRMDATYLASSITIADFSGDGLNDLMFGAQYATPRDRDNCTRVISPGLAGVVHGRDFATGQGFPAEIQYDDFDGSNGYALLDRKTSFVEGFSGNRVITCDLNKDGHDDLIISSRRYDGNDIQDSGRITIIYGPDSNFVIDPTRAQLRLTDIATNYPNKVVAINGSQRFGELGHSTTCVDINGDTYQDLVLCAPFNTGGAEDSGECYVIFGSDQRIPRYFNLTTLNGQNGFRITSSRAYNYLGGSTETPVSSFHSLSGGDINGDGIDDLAIGSPEGSATVNGLTRSAGRVEVIYGRRTGFNPTFNLDNLNGNNGFIVFPSTVVNGMLRPVTDTFCGFATHITDFDGDGIGDLCFSAPGDYLTVNTRKRFETEDRLSFEDKINPSPTIPRNSPMPLYNVNKRDAVKRQLPLAPGSVYCIYGKDSNLDQKLPNTIIFQDILDASHPNDTVGIRFTGQTNDAFLGNALSSLDINQDGGRDLVIGAYHEDRAPVGQTQRRPVVGTTYVAYGQPPIMPVSTNEATTLETTGTDSSGITETMMQTTGSETNDISQETIIQPTGIPQSTTDSVVSDANRINNPFALLHQGIKDFSHWAGQYFKSEQEYDQLVADYFGISPQVVQENPTYQQFLQLLIENPIAAESLIYNSSIDQTDPGFKTAVKYACLSNAETLTLPQLASANVRQLDLNSYSPLAGATLLAVAGLALKKFWSSFPVKKAEKQLDSAESLTDEAESKVINASGVSYLMTKLGLWTMPNQQKDTPLDIQNNQVANDFKP